MPKPVSTMTAPLKRDRFTHATRWWHRLPDGRVQCDLCPRACRLKEGQRGFCFVRGNLEGELVLTSYGRSSGFCVDPVEKKPLNHYLPGTAVFSFGTAGCNLACRFCQNWDISKARDLDVLTEEASPEAIADKAVQLGCRSVAFTYNDPVIFHEYARDTATACHERGLGAIAVTAGYVSGAAREAFFRPFDAANVDLKAFTSAFYRRMTGARLERILDNLEWLVHETDTWLELTTLLIPGFNDSEREIHQMCDWVREHLGPDIPMHFTAFHPAHKMPDIPSTPLASLILARRIARDCGIRYAYTGNLPDPEGQATRCHFCGERLIQRSGYSITKWKLDPEGHCPTCGTPLPGSYDPRPGHWGTRRVPVSM